MATLSQEVADIQTAKDIAMQIAAMNPVAIDEASIPQSEIDIHPSLEPQNPGY